MKKVISLLLSVILISGCDKPLNNLKSGTAETVTEKSAQVNPSPTPISNSTHAPSPLLTPKPMITPTTRSTSTPILISPCFPPLNYSPLSFSDCCYIIVCTLSVTAVYVIVHIGGYKLYKYCIKSDSKKSK
jgi:hypothetical protein